MVLREVDVLRDFPDKEQLIELNKEAFPPEERMPEDFLFSASEKGFLRTRALYDGEKFAGFYTAREDGASVYLCYLCVCPEMRNRGIGSAALGLMRKRFAGKQIVLDMERTDVPADNHAQRVSRLSFYKRAGFFETGYFLRYLGLDLALLCGGPDFDAADFRRLLDGIDAPGVTFTMSREP